MDKKDIDLKDLQTRLDKTTAQLSQARKRIFKDLSTQNALLHQHLETVSTQATGHFYKHWDLNPNVIPYKNLSKKEPIKNNFKSLEETRLSRKQVESMLQDTISAIKEDPTWCALIGSWCHVTIGTIPSLDDTSSLFVRVLYERYRDKDRGDLAAKKMLREELERILKKEVLVDMDSDSEDSSSEWEDSPSIHLKQPKPRDVAKPHKLKLLQRVGRGYSVVFFKYQDLTPTQLQLAEAKAVDVLVDFRLVGASTYQSTFWPIEVKKSSLYQLLCTICAPDTTLELSADHLAVSSRKYQWAASFGLILHQWTNSSAFTNPPPKSKSLKTTGGRFLGKLFIQWLDSIDKQGRAIPAASQPSCVDFDPAKLYRKIMTEVVSDTNFDPTQLQSIQLRCIIEETIISKAFLKHIQSEAFGRGTKVPDQPQKNISSEPQRPLPASEHCVLLLNVKRRTDVKNLFGSLVTCAPQDDRIPLNVKQDQAGDPHYVHPHDDLHLQCMAFRPEVYAWCQRDIVQMIDVDTGNCVGGVIFNAFNDTTLQELQDNHKAIATNPSVQWSEVFQRWAYTGKMVPIGSRLAKGGRRGDGYTTYPLLCGDSEDHIHAIFRHAHNADALLQSVKFAAPYVAKNIKENSAAAEMNRLGTSGANIFYCSDYLSPQHFDHDASWSICSQLDKTGATDEWNFCYTEWSAYIQTRANTVWWFESSHLHGTMAPAASVIEHAKRLRGGALSTGNHLTVRERDRHRAHAIAEMRSPNTHPTSPLNFASMQELTKNKLQPLIKMVILNTPSGV
ncbi:hypothetical protein EV424DRAFT_1353125 [Suillus variegatus]|nr:hypothetical protein EV424DRAFT_1353125 [Suillus variegatus]